VKALPWWLRHRWIGFVPLVLLATLKIIVAIEPALDSSGLQRELLRGFWVSLAFGFGSGALLLVLVKPQRDSRRTGGYLTVASFLILGIACVLARAAIAPGVAVLILVVWQIERRLAETALKAKDEGLK